MGLRISSDRSRPVTTGEQNLLWPYLDGQQLDHIMRVVYELDELADKEIKIMREGTQK